MLWLVTTLVGKNSELEPDEMVMLVEVISDSDKLVVSLGKAVAGGNSAADGIVLWLVIKSVEEASRLEGPAV